jgi:signal transduction histidine kinase/uncharacterized PurR-regulated membrane protein YhhQ (DUF165 family)
MNVSISLLICLWLLGLLFITLHRIGIRYTPMLLRVALFALVVVRIWRPVLIAIFQANPSLILKDTALSFTFISPILGPVIFITLLMVATYDGPLRANLLTFNLGAVALLSGVLTAIATHWFAALVIGLAPGLDEILSLLEYRQYAASIIAFVIGIYTNALIYQLILKYWQRKAFWLACLGSIVAGWMTSILFTFGGYAGTMDISWILKAELTGWTLSGLFLYPMASVYLRYLQRQLERGRWGQTQGSRSSLGIVRDSLNLRMAFEDLERQLLQESGAFRLLYEVRERVLRARTPEKLIEEICHLLLAYGGYRFVWVRLADDRISNLDIAASCGEEAGELDAFEEMIGSIYSAEDFTDVDSRYVDPIVLRNMQRDHRLAEWRGEIERRGFHSTAVLPLQMEGRLMGSINIVATEAEAFNGEMIEVLRVVADDLSHGIARLQMEKRRGEEFEALRKASLSMISSLESKSVLDNVLKHTLEFIDADDAHIFLYDGNEVFFGAARWAGEDHDEPYSEPRPHGLTYNVARSGKAIVINNSAGHELFQDSPWEGAIVGMPLKSGKRTVGVMNVAYLHPHEFEAVELRMLEILADQAAIAIENVRLYEASESERQRVYLLHDIAQVVSQTLDPVELLQRAVTLINDNLKGESTEAFMLDPYGDRMHLLASVRRERISIADLDSRIDMRVGKGLIGWVAEHGEPILRVDVRGDELWLRIPGVGENVRSALCVPVYANADLRAVIAVFHKKAGAFRNEHLDLLVSIAHQVGLALTNAERYQQINRRLSELTTLRHVAQVVNRRLNMQSLLFEVVRQVGEELGYPVVEIYLVEGDDLVLRAARGSEEAIPFRLPISQGVTGRAARQAEAIFVPDVSLDPEYVSGGTHSQCEIAVPLQKDDVVIGVLNVESPLRNDLNEDDMRLLMLLADNISIAIENAALYDRLSRHAEELEATIADRTEELAEALKKAQEADRLKTQFVSDVSHELRTPLSNILLYLELLGMGKPDRYKSYLETLNRETERLVVLIDDLLTVSRLDANTMELKPDLVDLNSIARGLVEDRKRLFAEKNLQVGFELSTDLPDVVADDRLLSQVVSNLMTNAMNYTLPGGCVTISTAIQKENGKRWATLSVRDTGLGITEEEKARVFQRFFRGKASRKVGTPGTGLGLAICEEIIERHEGWISLESIEGAGSAFTIWLPLGPDSTAKERAS